MSKPKVDYRDIILRMYRSNKASMRTIGDPSDVIFRACKLNNHFIKSLIKSYYTYRLTK